MPGLRRLGLRWCALADHDVTRRKLGLAQRLAEIACARAKQRSRLRPLRPHPDRRTVADQGDQRMHGTGGLDVEREARAPDALGGFDFIAAAVARDLELRHRSALRRREWNLEIPARR